MTQPFGCTRWAKYSAVALALSVGACDEMTTEAPFQRPVPQMAVTLPTQAQEQAFVCVNGPVGTYAFSSSEVDPFGIGTLTQGAVFNLAGDACLTVATTAAPPMTFGKNATITVVNTGMPTDVVLDSVTKITALFANRSSPTPTSTTTVQETGPSSSFDLGLEISVTLVYNFTLRPPPPPGGEGCTPGYWKQKQHFGNWTAPYTPNTQFSSVFANAFPGMSLLQVLGQGGGGLKALGRHTVAALLNAASAGVDGDFTTSQVIAAFNAAYASGDYETQHQIFAASNEQGCPLGRAE